MKEKLVEEVQSVFVNGDEKPSYHDYMNMKYLDNVIKETLRIYPSAAIIGRKINEDVQIPSG